MFQVLHSSAGAGKTHALVRHYLGLALASNDPGAYSRILALTFTNKAANEMRERILRYLRGLARPDGMGPALKDVLDTIVRTRGISPEDVRERAGRTLTHMLHHWPQLAVSTIDAFTRRVVMPFARDLRLDSELRMTTEEAYYRDLAVERLLAEAGTEETLTRLLTGICEQLQDEEQKWRPDLPLRQLSEQLTKEQAIPYLRALRETGNAQLLAIQQRLRESTRTFRLRLRKLGQEAMNAIEQAGIRPEDLAHGKGGPYGYLRQLARFDDWMDEKANTMKVLASGKWHSAKAAPNAILAIERAVPLMQAAISAVEDLRGTGELHRHAIACAVLRDLLPTAALHLLDEQLERIKHEEGVAFFSDLIKRVAEIVQNEPAPFLYERIGERYSHFLIDEFQDTSMLQWHALLPLIENALSGDGSALLVGDAKQAIYRWRNGEARQFRMLPSLFGKERMIDGDQREATFLRSHVRMEPLASNHRSARAIIRFNNALFGALRERLPSAAASFYDDHEQLDVREREGYVNVWCVPPAADGPDGEQDVIKPALALVKEAVERSILDGYRPGDIAVLVRTKQQGRDVAELLVPLGFSVVSPDGLSLGSDPGVRAIVALLAWLHRPDDVTSALAAQAVWRMGPGAGDALPFKGKAPHVYLRDFLRAHPRIDTRSPLVTLVCAIARALDRDPATNAFVLGLVNETHSFVIEHGDRPLAFLDHWDRVAARRSVGGSEDPSAIRVMTVHASKGLQFPVVIVPFADMSTRGRRDRLWIDARSVDPELPAALVRPDSTLDPLAIPEIEEERELDLLDRMNLLYVALTRPEERLYAAVDGVRKDEISSMVRDHLGLSAGDSVERGSPERAIPRSTTDGRSILLLPAQRGEGSLSLAIRNEAPEQWDPADPDPFRSHGRALHAILARVRTIADLPEALSKEADLWGIQGHEREVLASRMHALLSSPAVAPFFADGLRVRTEASIIDAQGNAHRPDRLTSDDRGTRVLDIKTGMPAEHHHRQVARYVDLLRELGESRVTGHLLYVRDGTVIDLDA